MATITVFEGPVSRARPPPRVARCAARSVIVAHARQALVAGGGARVARLAAGILPVGALFGAGLTPGEGDEGLFRPSLVTSRARRTFGNEPSPLV
jgi:hypothetical protein